MTRALRAKHVFKSRFLWRVYIALTSVLLVATMTMSVVFVWTLSSTELLDSRTIFKALAFANLGGVVIALIVGLWLSRSVRAGLEDITQVAQSLTFGDFNARVRRLRKDEFGILGLTLNLLGEELTDRMATLSRERAQLQAMLAGMVEGIVAVGDDDRILFSNLAADLLLKVDLTAARGKSIGEVVGLGVLLPLLIEARKSTSRVEREINLLDGHELITIDIKATKFRGDTDGGVVIVLHNVTNIRRLERVRRDFVANVSHELKTPLTSIKGYVETLQTGAKDDPLVLDRFLKKIDSNVVRLVTLVQDILSLASADNHDGKIHSEKIDWVATVQQVLSRHESEVRRKRIELNIEGQKPLYVLGDAEALTQIADNLLANAISYTPEGGKISLSFKALSTEAIFEIRDSGVGIPEEHLPRIFERFYRVDKARSRELGGTGLGLSIVKHLVAAMNGRVMVESRVGEGSTFTVALTRAQA